MIKRDLVNAVRNRTSYCKYDVENIIDVIFKSIADALESGDEIRLRGFGVFKTKRVAARVARNLSTGEALQIPEHDEPVFIASKTLKERVSRK